MSRIKAKNPYRIIGDGTVEITLARGKTALIDERDLPLIAGYRWYANPGMGRYWKALAAVYEQGKINRYSMARLVSGVTDGRNVNHKNGDTLDCRRRNLRTCTQSQSHQNQKIQEHSSRYKGVSWRKQEKKWIAYIYTSGGKIHLGYFENEQDAAWAYDRMAEKHFGEFARLNLPDQRMKEAS